MNAKSTSQPHLSTSRNEDVEKGDWYFTKPESEEKIQKFKVVVKNLPSVQKHKAHKWSNKNANKGVQSLSNLECIIENSYETDLEYIDSDAVDTSLDNYLDNINSSSTLDDSKKFMQSDRNLNRNENNSTQTNQYDKSIQSTKLLNSISTISTNSASMPLDNENRSNLNKTNSRLNSNYQSNLNMANKIANLHLPVELNKKSNYKQINTDDLSNGNYFFGPIDQEYEGLVYNKLLLIICSNIYYAIYYRIFIAWFIFLFRKNFISFSYQSFIKVILSSKSSANCMHIQSLIYCNTIIPYMPNES